MKWLNGSLLLLLFFSFEACAQFPPGQPRREMSIEDLIRQGLRLGGDALRNDDNRSPKALPPKGLPPKVQYDYKSEQVWAIYDAAGRLVYDLEYALQDIANEPRPRPNLYEEADAALREAIRFRSRVQPGSVRQNLYGDFQRLDQHVEGLIKRFRVSQDATLLRSAARIRYSDQQLHHAISNGDAAEDRAKDVIAREARILEQEARQFAQTARQVYGKRAPALLRDIDQFADQVHHFHETIEKGGSRLHVAGDFRMLDDTWHRIVQGLDNSRGGTYILRQAERVNTVHNQLHRLMGAKSPQTIIEYRFD